MLTVTWGTLKAIIKSELDLDEETFIDETELMNYGNKAIDEIEQIVMSVYQDYFRKKGNLTLVQGTSYYTLPSDIYANKLRHVHYINGSLKYKVNKIPPHNTPYVVDSQDYQYDIEHITPTSGTDSGVRFVLYPTARESGNFITWWYIRNANRITADSDAVDVPESHNYLRAYVAREVAKKEMSPLLMTREQELLKQEKMLRETLDQMTPDDQETIQEDMSFYDDFNTQYRGDY